MSREFTAHLNAMQSCTLCDDLPLGPRPIFQLSPDVRVLIAGHAPGRRTHNHGRPFDDASGDSLRQWLGIERKDFYADTRIGVFPMGLCYPGTGAAGDLPPRPICAATWRRGTMDRLSACELTLVLGRHALKWQLPHLAKGSLADAIRAAGPNGPIVVLPHPSPRNNRWLKQNGWFADAFLPKLR